MINNNLPLISILIPVYNREKYILETVSSALRQDYLNFEVVVVDNNSTDNTFKILNSICDKKLRIFKNSTNIGPVRNWEECIKKARGVYSKILWSDDLMEFNCISLLFKEMNNDVAFSFSAVEIFSNKKKELRYKLSNTKTIKSYEYLKSIIFNTHDLPVSPGCALFRTQDLKDFLIVNISNNINIDYSNLAIGNDLLIFLYSLERYNKVYYREEVLSKFRSHEDSISNISGKNLLKFHYDYAKLFFLSKFHKHTLLHKLYFSKYLLNYFLLRNQSPYKNYRFQNVVKNHKTFVLFSIIKIFFYAILNRFKKKGSL